MTNKTEHELTLKKWTWIVDNWNYKESDDHNDLRLVYDIPELSGLVAFCAYCENYWKKGCYGCPLNKINQECINGDDFFVKWKQKRSRPRPERPFWADMLRDTIRCLEELSYYEDKNRRKIRSGTMKKINDNEKALNYFRTATMQSNGKNIKPSWVPKKIYLPRTVRSDGFIRIIAKPGEYEALYNKYGAVNVDINGKSLGIKPCEFEVIEWQKNAYT